MSIASVVSDSVRPHHDSPSGSHIPGILQARTLEWVAISFSNAWKWKVKLMSLSRVWLLATPWTTAYQAPPSMGFARQEYWSGVSLPSPYICIHVYIIRTSLVAQLVKILPAVQETCVWSQGQEGPLEKGMATHSSILAWKIPWTEEPEGYSPWGHKESDVAERLSTAQHIAD